MHTKVGSAQILKISSLNNKVGPIALLHRDGVAWCKEDNAAKMLGKETKRGARQPRASITFPPKLYRTLENLAKEKKVSLAWVVREAAEMYVAGQSEAIGKMRGVDHG